MGIPHPEELKRIQDREALEVDQLRLGTTGREYNSNWLAVDVRNATHVKVDGQIEKIATRYGID